MAHPSGGWKGSRRLPSSSATIAPLQALALFTPCSVLRGLHPTGCISQAHCRLASCPAGPVQPWRRRGDVRKGLPIWPRTETLAALVSPVTSPLLTPPCARSFAWALWLTLVTHPRPLSLWPRVLAASMLFIGGRLSSTVWLLSSATSNRTNSCTQAPCFPYSSGFYFPGRCRLLHSLTAQILQPQPNIPRNGPPS